MIGHHRTEAEFSDEAKLGGSHADAMRYAFINEDSIALDFSSGIPTPIRYNSMQHSSWR